MHNRVGQKLHTGWAKKLSSKLLFIYYHQIVADFTYFIFHEVV